MHKAGQDKGAASYIVIHPSRLTIFQSLKCKLLNFKKDTIAHEWYGNPLDASTESLTTTLMAFTKPKSGKDVFTTEMNVYICQRMRLLINAVWQEDSENEDDNNQDSKDDNNDGNNNNNNNNNQDDNDGEEDQEDEFFDADLALVHKVNCNATGCYQQILGWMWGLLTAEEWEVRENEAAKIVTDQDQ